MAASGERSQGLSRADGTDEVEDEDQVAHCGLALAVALLSLSVTTTALASEPVVQAVEAVKETNGTFRFSVTVRHADSGWDHYAVVWQVLGEDGTRYGVRELLHPHVDEQPFTRSQSGISVPPGVKTVQVRCGDNRGDLGPAFKVVLPGRWIRRSARRWRPAISVPFVTQGRLPSLVKAMARLAPIAAKTVLLLLSPDEPLLAFASSADRWCRFDPAMPSAFRLVAIRRSSSRAAA